jgi:hypothetical protein
MSVNHADKKVQSFLRKVLHGLEHDSESWGWDDTGTRFFIKNEKTFASVLFRIMANRRVQGFVQQLLHLGFYKDPHVNEYNGESICHMFSHPNFIRGRDDLLPLIQKIGANAAVAPPQQSIVDSYHGSQQQPQHQQQHQQQHQHQHQHQQQQPNTNSMYVNSNVHIVPHREVICDGDVKISSQMDAAVHNLANLAQKTNIFHKFSSGVVLTTVTETIETISSNETTKPIIISKKTTSMTLPINDVHQLEKVSMGIVDQDVVNNSLTRVESATERVYENNSKNTNLASSLVLFDTEIVPNNTTFVPPATVIAHMNNINDRCNNDHIEVSNFEQNHQNGNIYVDKNNTTKFDQSNPVLHQCRCNCHSDSNNRDNTRTNTSFDDFDTKNEALINQSYINDQMIVIDSLLSKLDSAQESFVELLNMKQTSLFSSLFSLLKLFSQQGFNCDKISALLSSSISNNNNNNNNSDKYDQSNEYRSENDLICSNLNNANTTSHYNQYFQSPLSPLSLPNHNNNIILNNNNYNDMFNIASNNNNNNDPNDVNNITINDNDNNNNNNNNNNLLTSGMFSSSFTTPVNHFSTNHDNNCQQTQIKPFSLNITHNHDNNHNNQNTTPPITTVTTVNNINNDINTNFNPKTTINDLFADKLPSIAEQFQILHTPKKQSPKRAKYTNQFVTTNSDDFVQLKHHSSFYECPSPQSPLSPALSDSSTELSDVPNSPFMLPSTPMYQSINDTILSGGKRSRPIEFDNDNDDDDDDHDDDYDGQNNHVNYSTYHNNFSNTHAAFNPVQVVIDPITNSQHFNQYQQSSNQPSSIHQHEKLARRVEEVGSRVQELLKMHADSMSLQLRTYHVLLQGFEKLSGQNNCANEQQNMLLVENTETNPPFHQNYPTNPLATNTSTQTTSITRSTKRSKYNPDSVHPNEYDQTLYSKLNPNQQIQQRVLSSCMEWDPALNTNTSTIFAALNKHQPKALEEESANGLVPFNPRYQQQQSQTQSASSTQNRLYKDLIQIDSVVQYVHNSKNFLHFDKKNSLFFDNSLSFGSDNDNIDIITPYHTSLSNHFHHNGQNLFNNIDLSTPLVLTPRANPSTVPSGIVPPVFALASSFL